MFVYSSSLIRGQFVPASVSINVTSDNPNFLKKFVLFMRLMPTHSLVAGPHFLLPCLIVLYENNADVKKSL